jgi:hypothetical protein
MLSGEGGGRILRIAIILAVVALMLLAVAQLLLPTIAASTISSRIGRYGNVSSVSVKAFPAIKLLWGDADQVNVVAKDLVMTPEQTAGLLHEAKGTEKLNARVATLKMGPLRLTTARLQKRGDRVSAAATISEQAVAEALPPGVSISLLESGEGKVHVRVSGGLFGVGATINADGLAEGGKLVARPNGFPLGALRLTLFSDPRVEVEGVGAHVVTPKPNGSYRLTMRGRLR